MNNEKVSELQRLAEIGKISGSFIHDLANQITVMSLSMDRVEKSRKNIKDFISAMRKHMGGKDIRCYFSPEKKLRELTELFKYRAEKDSVTLSVLISKSSKNLKIYGSRIRFNQAFSNLLLNAIDSFRGLKEKRKRNIFVSIDVKCGTAIISIEDNGTGISPRVAEKIFDPFFTTKLEHGGIGLGLPTVKDIIEKEFGGEISFKSNKKEGTRFFVFIPLKIREEKGRCA